MIDWEKSAELNGMSVEDTKIYFNKYPSSGKKIVTICDNIECKKVRVIKFYGYHDLCHLCKMRTDDYREKISGILKKYWEDHPDDRKEYWENNPEARKRHSEILKKYYKDNPEEGKKHSERLKKYYKDNPEKVKKISDGQKKSFRDHPERAKKLSDLGKTKTGENSPNWKGGLSFGKYCKLFNEKFKEFIRDLGGRRCFLCGKSEEENGRKLDVHHVNYDKDCLCGSSCEFVSLCRVCHMKTNGRRKYWKDLIMGYLYPMEIHSFEF